jgi:hypothetical protein
VRAVSIGHEEVALIPVRIGSAESSNFKEKTIMDHGTRLAVAMYIHRGVSCGVVLPSMLKYVKARPRCRDYTSSYWDLEWHIYIQGRFRSYRNMVYSLSRKLKTRCRLRPGAPPLPRSHLGFGLGLE